jgi:hypothetical protein
MTNYSGLLFYASDPQMVPEILNICMDHLSGTGVLSYFQ